MNDGQSAAVEKENVDHKKDKVYSNTTDLEMTSSMTSSVSENNLTKFKEYIDDKDSEINKYIGENGVVYSYDTSFGVYSYDPNKKLVNSDGSSFKTEKDNSNSTFSQMTSMSSQMTSMMGGSKNGFSELMPGKGDNLVSVAVKENYDLLYGLYP